jgi:hypothetical protein
VWVRTLSSRTLCVASKLAKKLHFTQNPAISGHCFSPSEILSRLKKTGLTPSSYISGLISYVYWSLCSSSQLRAMSANASSRN